MVMETTELFAILTPIFRDILEEDSLVLTENLTANDVENWDSLSHVRLIVAIEQELGINFDLTEASNAKNVGDLIKQIQSTM